MMKRRRVWSQVTLPRGDATGFIEGELEPGRLAWVWEHLDRCEECVHWVAMVLAAGLDN
jgi:hypothetical protein